MGIGIGSSGTRECYQEKQPRSSKKIKARFLTAAALCDEFECEDLEWLECTKAAAEKDKQKEVDTAQRALRVADDALNCVFVGRLASYKKDDLKALALSLALSDKGTNQELLSRIQDYFDAHPDLKNNTRFSGLFQSAHRRNNVQSMGAEMNNGGQDQGDDSDREGHLYQDQINTQQHPTPVFEVRTRCSASAKRTIYSLSSRKYPHYNQPIYHGQHFYTHPG